MAENQNDQVVIAFYLTVEAAHQAAETLKQWDKANDDVKLGAIGVIAKEGGQVKWELPHKTGKGAAVGAVVGVIAGVLTGGIGLIGGAVGGGLIGGIAGRFMKASVGLTEEDIQKIGAELDAGKAALVVACDDMEVGPTSDYLAMAGGEVRQASISSETVAETAEAMAAAEQAPEAVSAGGEAEEASSGQGYAPAGQEEYR